MADPLEVAARLFAAIEAGDIDAVRELYHPDVEVWHNTDGLAQSRDANLATLA
jgi:ketosteroid isomerase-like protein